MTLDPRIFEELSELSEDGNELLDNGKNLAAINKWKDALRLLPEPKNDWEAATWLYASIGDALFETAEFGEAREQFLNAQSCPGGMANAFIHYRLGQCDLQIGMAEAGVRELLQAYMLEGREIFDADPNGFENLEVLKSHHLI